MWACHVFCCAVAQAGAGEAAAPAHQQVARGAQVTAPRRRQS